ncbi:MAG: hypothetical protein K2L85_02345 [Paramuribaculum sp.]|nr:hypothetical protein [Paramuribaculum sp.]
MDSTFFKSLFFGVVDGFEEYAAQWTVAFMFCSLSPPVLNLALIEKLDLSDVDINVSNVGFETDFEVVDVDDDDDGSSSVPQDENERPINRNGINQIFFDI